jgi:hypothetical protein
MGTAGKVAIVVAAAGGGYVVWRLWGRRWWLSHVPGTGPGAAPLGAGGGGGGPVVVTAPPFQASGAGYGPAVAPIVDAYAWPTGTITPPPPFTPPSPPGAPPAPPPPPPPPVPVTIIGAPLNGAGAPTSTTLYVPPTATDVQVLAKAADLAAINAASAMGLRPEGDDYYPPVASGPATETRRGRGHF